MLVSPEGQGRGEKSPEIRPSESAGACWVELGLQTPWKTGQKRMQSQDLKGTSLTSSVLPEPSSIYFLAAVGPGPLAGQGVVRKGLGRASEEGEQPGK